MQNIFAQTCVSRYRAGTPLVMLSYPPPTSVDPLLLLNWTHPFSCLSFFLSLWMFLGFLSWAWSSASKGTKLFQQQEPCRPHLPEKRGRKGPPWPEISFKIHWLEKFKWSRNDSYSIKAEVGFVNAFIYQDCISQCKYKEKKTRLIVSYRQIAPHSEWSISSCYPGLVTYVFKTRYTPKRTQTGRLHSESKRSNSRGFLSSGTLPNIHLLNTFSIWSPVTVYDPVIIFLSNKTSLWVLIQQLSIPKSSWNQASSQGWKCINAFARMC